MRVWQVLHRDQAPAAGKPIRPQQLRPLVLQRALFTHRLLHRLPGDGCLCAAAPARGSQCVAGDDCAEAEDRTGTRGGEEALQGAGERAQQRIPSLEDDGLFTLVPSE